MSRRNEERFCEEEAKALLENLAAFAWWNETPQGTEYWNEVYTNVVNMIAAHRKEAVATAETLPCPECKAPPGLHHGYCDRLQV